MSSGQIVGGRVLIAGDDDPRAANVSWSGPSITSVEAGEAEATELETIDASEALVLPGLIDLHGDAFERSLMPRGGVEVDVDLALIDNDHQLMGAGITTSFLSATDSWEPGLRSRHTLRRLMAAVQRRQGGPRLLVHVRHEQCNVADADELIEWIDKGAVHMLSFNDHTPGGIELVNDGVSNKMVERSGATHEELERLQATAIERRSVGAEIDRRLAAAARRAGCPTASHDAHSQDDLQRDTALGVAIAEFPTSIELARLYHANDVEVLLGAPNLVRRRSHLGNLSVMEALKAGAGSILCSDYHYPSMLQGPFVAAAETDLTFGQAWALGSANPARAAGLADTGRIEVGARADLVVVEPPAGSAPARVRAMIVAGEVLMLSRPITNTRQGATQP